MSLPSMRLATLALAAPRPRRPWLASAVLSLTCLLGTAPCGAAADEYVLDFPPDWPQQQESSAWEKDKIVKGAKRILTKLDDGKPANGHGGQAHLSITDAPAGKTLADLAADPAQREFLLRLYAKPPEVASENTKVKDISLVKEVPAVRLKAEGMAMSDAGTELPCVGIMVMTVVRKKLYRLRLFAWVTTGDPEQLRTDLDSIDVGFAFMDLTADPSDKPPPGSGSKDGPKEPGGPKEPEEPKPIGDSDEEKEINDQFAIQGWKAKKPKKLYTEKIDHAATEFRQIFLRGSDNFGSCDLTMDVYPNGMILDGKKIPDQDVRKFMTTSFWQSIAASYPKGALETFAWPKVKGGHFLVPPVLEPPRVLFGRDEPRPKVEDVDVDFVLKKLKFTEEIKNPAVGRFKCELAYRGVVRGNREREGHEISIRYAWRTEKFTFFIWATIRKDGAKRYLEPLTQFLESFEVSK